MLSKVTLPSSPDHSPTLSCSCGEKMGFSFPDFSPWLQDKIWEWPGDQTKVTHCVYHCKVGSSQTHLDNITRWDPSSYQKYVRCASINEACYFNLIFFLFILSKRLAYISNYQATSKCFIEKINYKQGWRSHQHSILIQNY